MRIIYSKYDMSTLIDFMQTCVMHPIIPLSWGISEIRLYDKKLTFNVRGCKYQGPVWIEENNLRITIRLSFIHNTFQNSTEALDWLDSTIE